MQFHLENAKARSEHRLKQNRARPIDFLVRDLLLGNVMDIGGSPPYDVFKNLTLPEVQDLREDILEYQVTLYCFSVLSAYDVPEHYRAFFILAKFCAVFQDSILTIIFYYSESKEPFIKSSFLPQHSVTNLCWI